MKLKLLASMISIGCLLSIPTHTHTLRSQTTSNCQTTLKTGVPPCGCPLIDRNGNSASYNNVTALSNDLEQRSPDPCRNDGVHFECVEYIKRYYSQALQFDISNWTGNATDYFSTANGKRLVCYYNGGIEPPAPDDILVYTGTKYGHVAVVTAVTLPQNSQPGLSGHLKSGHT